MGLMFQSGFFVTFNSIFSSGRPPGRLMPPKTSWRLIPRPSNAYCWWCLVQVKQKKKRPLYSQYCCILSWIGSVSSARFRGVLRCGLRIGLSEGHCSRGSDHFGRGRPIVWAFEGVQRKKHQPVLRTGREMLQVQPEVDEMVSWVLFLMYFHPRVQFLGAITTRGRLLWSLQGFHGRRSCAVRGLARLRHQPASRAAHLVRGRLRVRPAAVPSVGAQDGGEFCPFHIELLSLSVAAFAETWDITCPCAPVIFPIIVGLSRTTSLS